MKNAFVLQQPVLYEWIHTVLVEVNNIIIIIKCIKTKYFTNTLLVKKVQQTYQLEA